MTIKTQASNESNKPGECNANAERLNVREIFSFFSIFLDDIMAGTHSSEEKNGTNSWREYKTKQNSLLKNGRLSNNKQAGFH